MHFGVIQKRPSKGKKRWTGLPDIINTVGSLNILRVKT
jgi:hypothetical protein